MDEDPDVVKWKQSLAAGQKARRALLLTRVAPVAVIVILFGGCLGAIKWKEISQRNKYAPAPLPSAATKPLSDDERAKAEKIVADARARAKAIDAAKWNAVLGPPATSAAPTPGATCPLDGSALLPREPDDQATTAAKRTHTAQRMIIATTTDVVDTDGTKDRGARAEVALDQLLSSDLKLMKEGLAESYSGAAFLARLQGDVEKAEKALNEANDMVLVVKQRDEPVFDAAGSSFSLGRLRGRFYAVSRASHEIMCVADIDVIGPRDFTIAGANPSDLAGNARAAVSQLLLSDAIVAGITTMTRASLPAAPSPSPSAATSGAPRSGRGRGR